MEIETIKSNVGMSINFVRFLQELDIVNEGVQSFVGERCYMATGDLSNEDTNELELVTYQNKPSRAALTAKPGDVIFARMKGTNKVLLVTEKESNYIFSTGFVVIRSSENVNKSFLTHFLKSNLFQDEKDKLCTGATQKAINNQNIEKLKFPLLPLATQKSIAEILDTADALRRKDQELLKKYDELAQAIFIDMFGDPVKNEKEWVRKPFGDLFDSRLGKMLDAKKQTTGKKYKYLGNSNVQWFSFILDDLAEMLFEDNETKTFKLEFGDLLICEGGEVGRCAIWRNEKQDVFFQKAIHRARARQNNICSDYMVMAFWFYAKYGGFKDYVTTSTISHLTGEKLKTILFPVPPIELQNEFKIKIGLVENLKVQSAHKIGEDLIQSLIQKAFKGELVS